MLQLQKQKEVLISKWNNEGMIIIQVVTDKKSMDNSIILITGAAGNLGGLLAYYLKDRYLHLMTHKKEVSEELKNRSNIKIFKADLENKETLYPALNGVKTVVHFAGVLFKSRPEKFLPVTNTIYFSNLLEVAIKQGVRRIIFSNQVRNDVLEQLV